MSKVQKAIIMMLVVVLIILMALVLIKRFGGESEPTSPVDNPPIVDPTPGGDTPDPPDPPVNKFSGCPYYIAAYLDKYEECIAEHPELSPSDIITIVNTGIYRPFYEDGQAADLSKGYLVLVNKYNYLSADYEPDLEPLGSYGSGYLERTAAAAFRDMVDAAADAGYNLYSVSPYRSYYRQSELYTYWSSVLGQEQADRESARPGSSEHQLGLAVDINTSEVSDHFERTPEYAWLQENCWKYGFILRYLEDAEYITGYLYEPWHYRYVGPEHAEKIMQLGISYEEYYAYYIANPDKE